MCYALFVKLRTELYDKLIHYALNTVPYEACGLITGSIRDCIIEAASLIPISNHSKNPGQQFIMNPQEMIPYLTDSTNPVIGIFHSHPTAPPVPSDEDLETLWNTIPTHWILSLKTPDKPELQIYQIKKASTTSVHKLSFVIGQ